MICQFITALKKSQGAPASLHLPSQITGKTGRGSFSPDRILLYSMNLLFNNNHYSQRADLLLRALCKAIYTYNLTKL